MHDPIRASGGLIPVSLMVNADVWRRVTRKAAELECSPGIVIAAGLEALEENNHAEH
ncbi:MAG: hypothetical protein JWO62_3353 [Acidimicrobiaceae bacterium]|jgi:hypothetical protein|nr:hypothetical protein [Acidimicrobiaceae bacterium]